jgi:predicted O-methyltransferase YrrM
MDLYTLFKGQAIEGNCGECPDQKRVLTHLAKDRKSMLEIGFNAGHSAEVFLSANPFSTLVSFELGHHDYSMKAKEYIDKKFPDRHTLIIGSSVETLPAYIKNNPHKKFDLLFIDGGHMYDVCRPDIDNCRLLASPDHILIVDDIINDDDQANYTEDVTRAWNEVKQENMVKELGHLRLDKYRGFSWGRYIKRFIFCPVVNNFHLLEKAIQGVPPNLFDEYFIFNNSGGEIPINTGHWKVINDGRKTFMETQNIMRNYAISNGYDWYSFMHNDAEIIDDTALRLVNTANSLCCTDKHWSVIFTYYDIFCAYSTRCVTEIGQWGDNEWCKQQQSGYFLDEDYYNRMRLTHYKVYQLTNTNVLHNEPSNTIKAKEEKEAWEKVYNQVKTHYYNKWKNINVPDITININ